MTLTNDTTSPAQYGLLILSYAAMGIVWNLGVVGTKKIFTSEGMQWWRLGQAVAVGGAVGTLVALRGGDPNPGEFEAAATVAVPIVDKAVNIARESTRAGHEAANGNGELDPEEVRAMIREGFDQLVMQSMATEDLEDEAASREHGGDMLTPERDRDDTGEPRVIEEGP